MPASNSHAANNHTTQHGVLAGFGYTITTCAIFLGLIYWHEHAHFVVFSDTFIIVLLACLASYFRPAAARTLEVWELGKTVPLIMGRWLWVYFSIRYRIGLRVDSLNEHKFNITIMNDMSSL